jgi:hypothetical protein
MEWDGKWNGIWEDRSGWLMDQVVIIGVIISDNGSV